MSQAARDAAKADALRRHPECHHAEVTNGLTAWMQLTIVVRLWRTEECYLAGDPPRHEIGGYNPNYEPDAEPAEVAP